MKAAKIISHLEKVKTGEIKELTQFNFLFATFHVMTDKGKSKPPLIFGKYDSEKPNSYPFYKPFSKPFNLQLLDQNDPSNL